MDHDFRKLIDLQKLDGELKDISLFLKNIPSQIKTIEDKINDSKSTLENARSELQANQKLRRELEADVQVEKEKIKKYKQQLNAVKTNLEYTSLLKEIATAEKKSGELEEEIIAQMLAADEIEEDIRKAEVRSRDIQNQLSAEINTLNDKSGEMEKKKEAFLAERNELVPHIPPDQMRLYESIARKSGGTALSQVTDDFCSMCHMRIRPQMLNELITQTSLIVCEACGRILYHVDSAKIDRT